MYNYLQLALDNDWTFVEVTDINEQTIKYLQHPDISVYIYEFTIYNNMYLPSCIFETDVLHFRFKINDQRLQTAFKIGWYIKYDDDYKLYSPDRFPCAKSKPDYDIEVFYDKTGELSATLLIPFYYRDDNVLILGKEHKTKTKIVNKNIIPVVSKYNLEYPTILSDKIVVDNKPKITQISYRDTLLSTIQ